MSDESEGEVEREKSLLESAEEPKTVFEDIMDVDDYKREMEKSIRAELEHAQELAFDPNNWELIDVTQRMCTIDIFLGMYDKMLQYDPRCISLAKTKLQESIMWLNRAYYQQKLDKTVEKDILPK